MEQVFRNTELEARVSLNMNVLDLNMTPQVMNLRDVLRSFLEHREEVLVRRTKHRLARIGHRLEVLEGLLIAYLNLDEVIRIIREKDEPKAIIMNTWDLRFRPRRYSICGAPCGVWKRSRSRENIGR